MIVVRPSITVSSALRMRASVVASTDAVASSRIRTRGSTSNARAIDSRCRCPPESVRPRSPTLRVVAVGQRLDELVRLRPAGRLDDLLARGARGAVGDVGCDGGREEEGVLRDGRDGAAQIGEAELAHVDAVEHDAACLGVVVAGHERRERGLARPRAADHGERGAGGDLEIEVVQHRAVGVVAERHALEAQVAAAGRKLQRRRRIGDLGALVEDLEDALARGDGALVLPDPHADHAQRPDQDREVEVVGDEAAQREMAVDHEQAADEDDHREGELRQEVEQRAVARLDPRRVELALEHPLVAHGEALTLGVLLREGLDDAHSDDRLLRLRRDIGDALLDVAQHRV